MELQELEPNIYCSLSFDQLLNYPAVQGNLGESVRGFIRSTPLGKSGLVSVEGKNIVCGVDDGRIMILDTSIATTKNKAKDLGFFENIFFPVANFVLKQINRDTITFFLTYTIDFTVSSEAPFEMLKKVNLYPIRILEEGKRLLNLEYPKLSSNISLFPVPLGPEAMFADIEIETSLLSDKPSLKVQWTCYSLRPVSCQESSSLFNAFKDLNTFFFEKVVNGFAKDLFDIGKLGGDKL